MSGHRTASTARALVLTVGWLLLPAGPALPQGDEVLLPKDSEDLGASDDTPAGRLLRFDLRTREVSVVEDAETREQWTSFVRGELGALGDRFSEGRPEENLAGGDGGGASFTNIHSIADERMTWPYRAVVKVFTHYAGGGATPNCSGTLISPRHVLTAGHCVHDGDLGLATSVSVSPAFHHGDRPFGSSIGYAVLVWEGWTEDEDFDHDVALIELADPLGAVTGTFGYGFHNDCDYFLDNTFYSAGYPLDPGTRTSAEMYGFHGSFSDCETAAGEWYGGEITADARTFKGNSGGGVWWYDFTDGTPYVQAVLSNGDRDHTDFTRLDASKFETIRGVIAGSAPSAVDLTPAFIELSQTQLSPGGTIDEVSVLIYNDSSARFDGAVRVKFLLVDWPEGGGDGEFFTVLGSRTFALDIRGRGTQEVRLENIEVPSFLPEMRYRAEAELVLTDAVSNNVGPGTKSVKVHVGVTCEGKGLSRVAGSLIPGLVAQQRDGEISDAQRGKVYRVMTQEDGLYTFALSMRSFPPRLCLFDEEFGWIASGTTSISSRLAAGSYNLAVISEDDTGGAFRITHSRRYECSGLRLYDRGEIAPEGVWQTVAGSISGRGDYYSFDVERAATYRFSLCRGGGTTAIDLSLCLTTDNGRSVEVEESGCDPGSEVTATLLPARYRIAVAPATGRAGSYSLAHSLVGACSERELDPSSVVATIEPGLEVETVSEARPRSYNGIVYEVIARDPALYFFHTCDTPPSADYDTEMCLFDDEWNLVREDDDSCGEAQSALALPLEPGRYWLAIAGSQNTKGGHLLQYYRVPACQGRRLVEAPEKLEPAPELREVRGSVSSTTARIYSVRARTDGTYRFSLCSNSEFAGRLCLYTQGGEVITEGSGSCRRNVWLEIALQAGVYQVAVAGAGDSAGSFSMSYSMLPMCSRSELDVLPDVLRPKEDVQTISGAVESRTGRLYEIDAVFDGEYSFRLCGPDGVADWSTSLCLFTEEGGALGQDHESCQGKAEVRRFLSSGTYRLGVATQLGQPGGVYTLAYSGEPSHAGAWIRCDHNCDGKPDISDAIAGLTELFVDGTKRACCVTIADCNGDGGKDITDWIFLLSWQFGGGAAPPGPFPECGGSGCPQYRACD